MKGLSSNLLIRTIKPSYLTKILSFVTVFQNNLYERFLIWGHVFVCRCRTVTNDCYEKNLEINKKD